MKATKVTGFRLYSDLLWFRVLGYGLWMRWGSGPDLHVTRTTAHYAGRLRWKVLHP